MVQVVIGEQRGEGVKCAVCRMLTCTDWCGRMACKCFWDSDADSYVQDVYMNVRCPCTHSAASPLLQDSLFCVVAAFGVYYY